jgi:hypothetical protein
MAVCNNLTSILKSCDNNSGGIVKFYVIPADYVTGFTASTGTLTNITLSGASQFVEFEFNRNTGNFDEVPTINLQNGSTFYAQTINLQLARREAAKRQSLLLIASGQPDLTVIIKDSNGLYWGFGFGEDKVNLTGGGGGSGTAKADLNGYSLVFTSEASEPAYEVDDTIIAGLI